MVTLFEKTAGIGLLVAIGAFIIVPKIISKMNTVKNTSLEGEFYSPTSPPSGGKSKKNKKSKRYSLKK